MMAAGGGHLECLAAERLAPDLSQVWCPWALVCAHGGRELGPARGRLQRLDQLSEAGGGPNRRPLDV